jgi:hypothetical protein
MSARHSSPSPSPHGTTSPGPAAVADTGAGRGLAGSRGPKIFAGLAVSWSIALLVMVVQSRGQVNVSPGQIQKADLVVIARPLAGERERLEVERTFKGEAQRGDRIRVWDLADAGDIPAGEPRIFALSRFRDDFALTRLEGQRPDLKPLTYPVTSETIEQVKADCR